VPTAPTALPAQADQQAPKPPVAPTIPLRSSPLAGSLETPPAVEVRPPIKSSIGDQATVPVSPPYRSRRRLLLIGVLALLALLVIFVPLFFLLMPRGEHCGNANCPPSTATSTQTGTQ